MGKSGIKKALKITAWVVGVFLFLDLLLVGLLFVPAIQTFVVHKVTAALSEKWGTEISIGDIHITPTLKLVAHEVAIKDHHHENMIHSGTVKGRLRGIKTKPLKLHLGNVEFHDLDVTLRTYQDEDAINIAKWAAIFKSDKPKSGFELTSTSVDIKNGRFVLINDNTRVVFDTTGNPGIDYAFLEFADLDIEAKDFRLNGADVALKFKQLAFNQYGGFQLQQGSGDFRICDTTLTFDNLKLKTPQSDLDLDLAFRYDNWKDYGDFLDSVDILAAIRPSTIAMNDIAGFAPAIRGMGEVFHLQADTVRGKVNDFELKNVKVNWLDHNLVQGDIAIKDVTHFNDADFDVTLDSTVVNLADMSLFSLPGGKTLKSSKILNKIGTVTASGTFRGGLSQFNTNLLANTGLGNIRAIISTYNQDGHLNFKGDVSSKDFRLAKLAGNGKVLGTSNLDLRFEGKTNSTGLTAANLKTATAHVDGNLRRFPVMGYPLQNIRLNGDYHNGLLNATLDADDPNLQCDVIAQLDISQSEPYLQGSIDLPKLAAGAIAQKMPKVDSATAKGFDKVIAMLQRNPALQLSFDHFQISMHGKNLDNCNGFLGCDNLKLTFSDDSLANDRLRLTTINSDRLHKYILSSSLISATYESTYPIATVIDTLQALAHNLFPSLIPAAKGQNDRISEGVLTHGDPNGYIKLNARTYNTRPVTKLFYPDLYISSGSVVNLDIHANHVDDRAEIDLPFFGIRNKVRLHNFQLDGNTTDIKTLALHVTGDSALVYAGKNNLLFEQADIKASAANDIVHYDLSWYNPFNTPGNISELSGSADISKTNDIILKLNPSRIFLKDYECHFNDQNDIHIRPHRYELNNLIFSNQNSSVAFNGAYDTKDSSRLSMAAKNIDISLVNPLLKSISFGGRMSADLNLLNRRDRRLLFGKLITDELNMNDTRLGDLFVMAGLNNDNVIRFTGGLFNSQESNLNYEYLSQFSIRDFQQEKSIIANISGSYEKKNFQVKAIFDTLQADFLEPFLSGFSDELTGTASGELSFRASPDSPYIDGKVHVLDAEMGISALGTRYHVTNQDILFDKEGITFPNMTISDKDNNTATLSGKILHDLFKNMRLDLRVNTDRILVLNTTRKPNDFFFGTGYVKGDVSITGSGGNLYFTGSDIQTLKGSKIVLAVSSTNSASETDQIRFVVRDSTNVETLETPPSTTNLNFDFTFDVTNDADVVLLLDPIGGTLNARADGRFRLVYNSTEDLNLYGNLMLHSGEFKLSFYDVVNTKFTLVNGGTINFDGPLENMTVSLSAYKTSKTSLANIIPAEYLPSGNVDVKSILRLNGPLMQRIEPTFGFELPNSSSEVRNLFYTAIDTQNTENMTKQFAYFLVTNSFMPENMFSQNTTGGIPGMNLFSNMINNLLSNVIDSKRGGFGITYNQATESTSAEYGVKANANLFNDRISMSTSIGYYDDRTVENAYNNIYGDFTVEYLINPSGTWRVKAYTYIGQRDDYYYYLGNDYNNYVAGVALSYKQDFDSRKRNRNRQQGIGNRQQATGNRD